jgi:hypothetical protein
MAMSRNFKSRGFEYIREGTIGEGYGICDVRPDTHYYDYAFADSGNWGPPVARGTALPLTIKRTTPDGIYTLTQVFTRNVPEPTVKITMTLKNNTAAFRDFVLLRYADIDANNAQGGDLQNWFDNDDQSVWACHNGFNLFGMMLSSVPTATPHVTAVVDQFEPLTLVPPMASPRQ